MWPRFGDVPNYVEPFAGSLAVLLGRPTPPRIETVNDLDCYLANFWRAVASSPEEVATFADWPVNEADLHARHRWLVNQEEFRERMKTDPDYFDTKIAGWWVWGICQWIGSGWCATQNWGEGKKRTHGGSKTAEQANRPHIGTAGIGINGKRVRDGNRGVHLVTEQKPMPRGDSGAAGAGIHASSLPRRRPSLTAKGGVLGDRPGSMADIVEKMPRMDRGTDSRLASTGEAILAWMLALQDRLRRVRVCCGDWQRILGRSSTECIGVTAVFLDPPYAPAAIAMASGRDGFAASDALYNHHDAGVSRSVREWAIANGDNQKLRIALCGYEGEHEMPDSWECVAWKATGGYAASAGNNENSRRERIWFSPHCLRPQSSLFHGFDAVESRRADPEDIQRSSR